MHKVKKEGVFMDEKEAKIRASLDAKIRAKKRVISEKLLEKKIVSWVRSRTVGGEAVKMGTGLESGWPDREILLTGGFVCFVEVKSTGEPLRKQQALKKQELERMGYVVFIVDDLESLNIFQNFITIVNTQYRPCQRP